LWIPIAQDTEFQRVEVERIVAPAGHAIAVEPTLGNRILHVRLPVAELPLEVFVDYEVERYERLTDLAATREGRTLAAAERSRYLGSSELVPVGAEVSVLARFAPHSDDELGLAHDVYDHVLQRMYYDKPANSGWGRGSTPWACTEGFGNCTDYHAYFMSLTRTHGIPSRFIMGLPLPADVREGEVGGYHCWAEFFVEGKGWIPVDISEADKAAATSPGMVEYYFGGLTADRVEFTHGRDVRLVPAARVGTLNFFIYPYCEIDGVPAPKDAVVRRFSFSDL
jgi:transglutaminase-like putative cysteine protease